ncbi:hypothetical protein ACHAXT_009469 [Thalassiosira profunda]
MEATAPSGVGGSKAASARKAVPAAGADDRDISDDVPLFAFDASNTDTRRGGRPKRKLKAIARFESMSWAGSSVLCKIGEGFACPQCAATCSYDAKECTECRLPCYYEAGMGALVMKEREIDQAQQHLVQKRAPRRKKAKGDGSLARRAAKEEEDPALNQQSPRTKGGDDNQVATGVEAAWDEEEERLGALIYKFSRTAQARADAEEKKRRRSIAAPHSGGDELQPPTKKRGRKAEKEGASPLTAAAATRITTHRDETPTKREIYEENKWAKRYDQLQEYKKEHGHCNVPRKYEKNPQLGEWVHTQRNFRKKGKLSGDRIQRLNGLGFQWRLPNVGNRQDELWNERYELLKAYKTKHGHCNVPQRYAKVPQLGRRLGSSGGLAQARIDNYVQKSPSNAKPNDGNEQPAADKNDHGAASATGTTRARSNCDLSSEANCSATWRPALPGQIMLDPARNGLSYSRDEVLAFSMRIEQSALIEAIQGSIYGPTGETVRKYLTPSPAPSWKTDEDDLMNEMKEAS